MLRGLVGLLHGAAQVAQQSRPLVHGRHFQQALGTRAQHGGLGGVVRRVEDGVSGILFNEQTTDAVVEAIKKVRQTDFLPATLRRKAKRFEKSLFITKIRKVVHDNS